MEKTKKSFLKTILIGGAIGLGVGLYAVCSLHSYGYLISRPKPNIFLNIPVIIGLILFRVAGPVIGIFISIMPTYQNLAIILAWFFLGMLITLIGSTLVKSIVKGIIKGVIKIHQILSKIGPKIN